MKKEEMLKKRLEQLSIEDDTTLRERMNLGQEAEKFIQTSYWQNLELKLSEAIANATKRKQEFSFIQKYYNPNDKLSEINALVDEITVTNFLDILDTVKFHIEDGRLSEKVLRQKVVNK